MSKSKQTKIISDVKRALDAALSEGAISNDTYARINVPGLKVKRPAFSWDTDEVYHPPESEPMPELEPVPQPEPEPEPVPDPEPEPVQEPAPEAQPDSEYRDAVVVDEGVSDMAEDVNCTEAPEDVPGTDSAAWVNRSGQNNQP